LAYVPKSLSLNTMDTYLESFINYENKLGDLMSADFTLDRIKALLGLLDNPQKEYKVVHVAGSKGKGSVCAMTAQILAEQGYRVGLYTSPHLNDCRERIRILGDDGSHSEAEDIFDDSVRRDDFAKAISICKPTIEKISQDQALGKLTYYEVLTAIALFVFKMKNVDIAVLETGLGGRLDATNVVESDVCAITSISLEHTAILGNTLKEISQEKAAIIKSEKQKVVVAHQEPEVKDVVEKRCIEYSLRPRAVGYNVKYSNVTKDVDGQTFDCQGKTKEYLGLQIPLLGEHQLINASVVVGIAESLNEIGIEISDQAISEGLKKTFWPGRFEIIVDGGHTSSGDFRRGDLSTRDLMCVPEFITIIDSAHNEASAKCLTQTMQDVFPDKEVTLVIGISEDKQIKEICTELGRIANKVIFTKSNNPRAIDLEEHQIEELFAEKECYKMDDTEKALELAKEITDKEGIILVAGSIFVISEAREICTSIKV